MESPAVRIAILDDEEKLRLALARLLRAHGCEAVGFACAEELLAALGARRFDCVLLDLFMPGLSGFDVLAALRAGSDAPPVIVISAHDEPESTGRARALGAIDCLRKPVAAPALLGAIERAVRRS